MTARDWSWDAVKAALQESGWSLRRLSRAHGRSPAYIAQVKCYRVPAAQEIIAAALDRLPHEIWPARYDANGIALTHTARRPSPHDFSNFWRGSASAASSFRIEQRRAESDLARARTLECEARRYRARAAMRLLPFNIPRTAMGRAWALARKASVEHGGRPAQYFAAALRQVHAQAAPIRTRNAA